MLVGAEAFINRAIATGEQDGLASLDALEQTVFAVSEAEVHCDKDGIDSLIDRYGPDALPLFATAFAEIGAAEIAAVLSDLAVSTPHPEKLLSEANALIAGRAGYSYDKILAYVEARI